MQVGPLAQILMGVASKHELTMKWLNYALEKCSALAKKPIAVDSFIQLWEDILQGQSDVPCSLILL